MDQLPVDPKDFIKSATQHRRPASNSGDSAFLKFSGKDGGWSLGKDDIDVAGEEMLVNSLTLGHGFVRWGEKPPARAFASITHPLPAAPAPFDGVDDDGSPKTYHAVDARRFTGKFLAEDLGDFSFESNSMGGVERVDELYDAILTQYAKDPEYFYPRVALDNDFYKRSTGKVFKPIFEIVAWCDIDGNEKGKQTKQLEEKQPEPEPEPEEEPKRRRRRRA